MCVAETGSSSDWMSSAEFDWSQPVSNNKEEELVIRWDDPELESEEKEEEPPTEEKTDLQPTSKGLFPRGYQLKL